MCLCAGEMSKCMLTFNLELDHVHTQRSALTHDFSQHGNMTAVS